MSVSRYSKTFTSYSGADIVATFNGVVIGELQAITYSVTREKAPIYVMGDPNPKSFSRGKRGIAGSIVFTVFDRDSLHGLKQEANVYAHGLNSTALAEGEVKQVQDMAAGVDGANPQNAWKNKRKPIFSDEIPPFDITINFLNEHGQAAKMTLYGVEILNEGMGMSIDDLTTEKACTFIARNLEEMAAQDDWEG